MSQQPPKYFLRKLRFGVTIQFYGYDHDGIPQWVLHDSGRNKFFVLGWPEYEMISRWDMGDGQAIIDAVNRDTTLHLEMQDFDNLRDFLYNNYLVEHRWRNVYQKAKEHKLIRGENLAYWFLRYYLFFRIPLLHPDKILTRTKAFGDFLFSPYTSVVMIILGIIAVYQIGMQWDTFVHTFSSIFNWQGLIFYFIAFSIAKFFHELGHAYMCKRYGVSVPTMGVAFLVFWPVLYTDTTLSWSLPMNQRLRVALAGMWVETYVTIIAALIWANIHNVTLQMICYVTVAVNWVSTLLINVSPFMRFDGYYVLADLLKMPNLQGRAFALARWQIRQWLFDLDEPPPEIFSPNMHKILVAYAITTWLYRLAVYFGIALLVYHYFFKVVGIILFGIEIYAFILRPVFMEVEVWYKMRAKFTLNRRTKITIVVATGLLLFLLLPLNPSIKLNATLSYEHQFIFAPSEGILQNTLPQTGTLVEENQIVAVLKSPEVEYNLNKSKLQYEKVQIEIRRASLSPKYTAQKNNLIADAAQKKAEYEKWLNAQEKLILRAPFKGRIGDVAIDYDPGVTIKKGAFILDVTDPTSLMVEAFVDAADVSELEKGVSGDFYPSNTDLPVIPVKVSAIEPMNVKELAFLFSKELSAMNKKEFIVDTPSYLASDLGGKIPTEATEEGKYVPVESIYRVLLKPETSIPLNNVQIGTVNLYIHSRSIVYKGFYKIKSALVRESSL